MGTTCPCCNGHVRDGICEECESVVPDEQVETEEADDSDEPDKAPVLARARKDKRGPIRPRPRPPIITSK
jgi:hypothetical protein